MYRKAFKFDDEIVFYFDEFNHKYVAKGGTLAWRINNPGLLLSANHYARKHLVGSCDRLAIFPHVYFGHQAFVEWMKNGSIAKRTIRMLARRFKNPTLLEFFSEKKRVYELSLTDFEKLIQLLEKGNGYHTIGNEAWYQVPKISAKIQTPKKQENLYYINDQSMITKSEAIERIGRHELDAVIINRKNGLIYIKSRPGNSFTQVINHDSRNRKGKSRHEEKDEDFPLIARSKGIYQKGQPVWAFVNGILNSRSQALKSTKQISKYVNRQQVFTLPNDTKLFGFGDLIACGVMKLQLRTPIVNRTARFFQHLIYCSQKGGNRPIIVFTHSQGALIASRALELLRPDQRRQLRIYTFGGACFIPPGKCHPDSWNYASIADPICLIGSPILHKLALRKYSGMKQGKELDVIIKEISEEDALFHLDTLNRSKFQRYVKRRIAYYEKQFVKLKNVVLLPPMAGLEHSFLAPCYQKVVKELILQFL